MLFEMLTTFSLVFVIKSKTLLIFVWGTVP